MSILLYKKVESWRKKAPQIPNVVLKEKEKTKKQVIGLFSLPICVIMKLYRRAGAYSRRIIAVKQNGKSEFDEEFLYELHYGT